MELFEICEAWIYRKHNSFSLWIFPNYYETFHNCKLHTAKGDICMYTVYRKAEAHVLIWFRVTLLTSSIPIMPYNFTNSISIHLLDHGDATSTPLPIQTTKIHCISLCIIIMIIHLYMPLFYRTYICNQIMIKTCLCASKRLWILLPWL